MKTCKLSALFDIQYGNSLELVYLDRDVNGINFVSRTAKNNGVSGKVKKVAALNPFPAGLLTVAVGGSVMETFLQQSPFYTGFHVMVLTPKIDMTTSEKLYYCCCIRANYYKYSYGRQANVTLEDLPVPEFDSIPSYVGETSVSEYGSNLIRQVEMPAVDTKYPNSGKSIPLGKLFDTVNGLASSEVIRNKTKLNDNWIPYIRPSYRQETSIDAYVNKKAVSADKIFPAGTLYVSTDGQGSHTYSYVSTFEFVPNSNVTALLPKRKMSLQEKLFYAGCITANRYKFSYGRKPKGFRLTSVLLPEYPPEYVTGYEIDKAVDSFSDVLDRV